MEPVAQRQPIATLRSIPSVDEVVRSAAAEEWLAELPRGLVTDLVREALDGLREDLLGGRSLAAAGLMEAATERVAELVRPLQRNSLIPVINATGVILHTNLGRAPLGKAAVRAMVETAASYSNLEYSVQTGERGKRDVHCSRLLARLLGARAVVVNNNAAAIFLTLRELAGDGEVIVSRGELVEIGDGFRIRDILEASGADLREVGATNRTTVEDYERVVGPRTRAIVRIHPSNFQQVGFTGKPSLAELVALAQSTGVPLVEDLGSGCLVDLTPAGIRDEPPVRASLSAGADLVTFSGDKLLGGPQAGIIAGDADLVGRIRRNPLFRAVRVDKLAVAALEATLRNYLLEGESAVPVLSLMRIPQGHLRARAERLRGRLAEHGVRDVEVAATESLLGGGSTPMQGLPSVALVVTPPKPATSRRVGRDLRRSDPPVVVRTEKGRLWLDLRTVFENQDEALIAAILRATGAGA